MGDTQNFPHCWDGHYVANSKHWINDILKHEEVITIAKHEIWDCMRSEACACVCTDIVWTSHMQMNTTDIWNWLEKLESFQATQIPTSFPSQLSTTKGNQNVPSSDEVFPKFSPHFPTTTQRPKWPKSLWTVNLVSHTTIIIFVPALRMQLTWQPKSQISRRAGDQRTRRTTIPGPEDQEDQEDECFFDHR